MRKIFVSLAFMFLAIPGAVNAKSHFAAYEGKDAIQEGRGGTKINKNGIDYWTTGTPPRRYQVLGIITDKRAMGCKICGDAIGSPAVANATKEAGGDAVVFMDEQNRMQGTVGSATASGNRNFASGFGWSAAVGDRVATLLVIKYLQDDAQKP